MTSEEETPAAAPEKLTLEEALELVAATLDNLRAANLELQRRAGALLEGANGPMIEGLQILDHQAQVLEDVSATLTRLARLPGNGVPTSVIDRDSLFQLDATRHSLRLVNSAAEQDGTPRNDDIWI